MTLIYLRSGVPLRSTRSAPDLLEAISSASDLPSDVEEAWIWLTEDGEQDASMVKATEIAAVVADAR